MTEPLYWKHRAQDAEALLCKTRRLARLALCLYLVSISGCVIALWLLLRVLNAH